MIDNRYVGAVSYWQGAASQTSLRFALMPLRSGVLLVTVRLQVQSQTFVIQEQFNVSAGPPAPGKFAVRGPGAQGAVSSQSASFFIQARDAYENPAVSLPPFLA